MKTITYEGDGLIVEIEMGKPTVSTGLVADAMKSLLLPTAQTTFAKQHVETFSDILRHTRSVKGYAFVLPSWNSTVVDYLAVWQAWRDIPEELGAMWIDAMVALRDGERPLANRSDSTTSESSDLLLKNLQKVEGDPLPLPTNN